MDDDQIRQAIELARAAGHSSEVTAHTYLKGWGSASRPVLLACSDGRDYVVKGRQNGRMIVNDRLVGLLGALMEAPVGEVALVDLTQDLVGVEPAIRSHATGALAWLAFGEKLHVHELMVTGEGSIRTGRQGEANRFRFWGSVMWRSASLSARTLRHTWSIRLTMVIFFQVVPLGQRRTFRGRRRRLWILN